MHYINGLWVKTGSHAFSSINPATGETIWEGFAAGEKEVTDAVSAANRAFPAWSAKSYEDRLAIVDKFKSLIDGRKNELAELIAQETGKTLWDSKGEVAAVIAKLNTRNASAVLNEMEPSKAAKLTMIITGATAAPIAWMPNCIPTPLPAISLGVASTAHACSTGRMA